ncbi:MAG: MBL fold metallo-hydrolase [Chitinophagaceae bacterium]|nr:MBL fold metallo-hydrolase [Chitinophagaceae bacterium]
MQRRSFLRNSGLTLAALALLNKESLAAFLNDPAWKIKMLTDDIGIFTEKGGTIAFYLSREGAVVVDSQFPDSVQHLIDELKKKSEKPFRLLINTHHHGDHTGGNIVFKDLVPHVLAHANSKINQQQSAIKQKTEDKQLYPDQTYTDTWCEKIGKEKICLHHFGAGHTNGDSFIHFTRANIVHVGDLVFNRRHPYVDKSAGADIASWIKVLDKAVKTFSKKTTFICGHAGQGFDVLLKADDLKAFGEYLGNVLKFTEAGIKAGKTKEEILKATEIPGSPEWKGSGIDRPLGAAYTELTMK